MDLNSEINELILSNGGSLVGFADLSIIPKEDRNDFMYGVVIARGMRSDIISGIGDGPTSEYYDEYLAVNNLLDYLDNLTADFLMSKGHDSLSRALNNVTVDHITYSTRLPHCRYAFRHWLDREMRFACNRTVRFSCQNFDSINKCTNHTRKPSRRVTIRKL